MEYEWTRWPDGSLLLGPLGLIWYDGLRPDNLTLCGLSVAMVFAFLIRPHSASAAVSLLGVLNWLFWGVVALGIGC